LPNIQSNKINHHLLFNLYFSNMATSLVPLVGLPNLLLLLGKLRFDLIKEKPRGKKQTLLRHFRVFDTGPRLLKKFGYK
ncbi:hypothetical protein ACJX0J_011143, partial [Zea mays]